LGRHEDPEGIEAKTILRHVPFEGRNVLEIGCGDGRLTFGYARTAKRAVGVDPELTSIQRARKKIPKDLAGKLHFQQGKGEELKFPDESFDIVFFSWSLCCTDIQMMGNALRQAWRVLKPNETLINLQGSQYQPFGMGTITYLITRKFPTSFEDEGYREARYALKYAAIVERKFDLKAEEEFTVNTYYDRVEDLLEDLDAETRQTYDLLDKERKAEVRQKLRAMRSDKGIVIRENAVLSILRKVGSST
jgi:ubiquinone/menaquinone biosynthesis C-methylase UbiE